MPEIQEIASLSGPTSENKTESSDAIAVTLTGTIGLPTVAMVSVIYQQDLEPVQFSSAQEMRN